MHYNLQICFKLNTSLKADNLVLMFKPFNSFTSFDGNKMFRFNALVYKELGIDELVKIKSDLRRTKNCKNIRQIKSQIETTRQTSKHTQLNTSMSKALSLHKLREDIRHLLQAHNTQQTHFTKLANNKISIT